METADDPTGRALSLLARLTSRPHWSGPELAGHLGVTTRTVRRDVERLRRLGYDIDAAPGTDGGYRLRAGGGTVAPVFLDGDESVAIVTALLAAVATESTGMVDASLRALAKLHHVVPAPARGSVDAVQRTTRSVARGQAPTVAPRDVAALAEACRDGRAVRFGYRARDGAPSQRRVEPNALVTVRAVWYLIAYDLDRADWRLFRVDRMQEVEVTGHGTLRRALPGGDAMAFLATSLADMPYPFNATVEVGRPADAVLDALGWLNPRRVDALDRRRCRLRLGAASVEDLVEELLDVVRLGAALTIDAPPEVRRRLAEVAAATSAAVTAR